MRLSLVFFLMTCALYNSNAQINKYQFSHLDINNGLSHNQVNCIYKDSKGFMWFGAIAGLNRYDGYTLKIGLSHVLAGKYTMEVYKVGSRINGAYTRYVDMGIPRQLNKQQVEKLKEENGSFVITREIEIKSKFVYSKEFDIRENDVILLNRIKTLKFDEELIFLSKLMAYDLV